MTTLRGPLTYLRTYSVNRACNKRLDVKNQETVKNVKIANKKGGHAFFRFVTFSLLSV